MEVEHLSYWETVTQRLKDGAADVAIVQVDFPPDDAARCPCLRSLEILTTVAPFGGVIPYLCPPGELIRKAAAVEVEGLCSFGFRSPRHLAVLLGYSDPRTLSRLYEECTGKPLGQRLRTAREKRFEAVSASLSDLSA